MRYKRFVSFFLVIALLFLSGNSSKRSLLNSMPSAEASALGLSAVVAGADAGVGAAVSVLGGINPFVVGVGVLIGLLAGIGYHYLTKEDAVYLYAEAVNSSDAQISDLARSFSTGASVQVDRDLATEYRDLYSLTAPSGLVAENVRFYDVSASIAAFNYVASLCGIWKPYPSFVSMYSSYLDEAFSKVSTTYPYSRDNYMILSNTTSEYITFIFLDYPLVHLAPSNAGNSYDIRAVAGHHMTSVLYRYDYNTNTYIYAKSTPLDFSSTSCGENFVVAASSVPSYVFLTHEAYWVDYYYSLERFSQAASIHPTDVAIGAVSFPYTVPALSDVEAADTFADLLITATANPAYVASDYPAIAKAFAETVTIPAETEVGAETGTATGVGEALASLFDFLRDILQKILNGILSIPGAIGAVKDAVIAVPKAITDFFTVDTAIVSAAQADLAASFSGHFQAFDQIKSIFSSAPGFDDTIPVFYMPVPEPIKFAFPDTDQIKILDLTPYETQFKWLRMILSAGIWIAFAGWISKQFDVDLHIG